LVYLTGGGARGVKKSGRPPATTVNISLKHPVRSTVRNSLYDHLAAVSKMCSVPADTDDTEIYFTLIAMVSSLCRGPCTPQLALALERSTLGQYLEE
jgi:hypothetical protein